MGTAGPNLQDRSFEKNGYAAQGYITVRLTLVTRSSLGTRLRSLLDLWSGGECHVLPTNEVIPLCQIAMLVGAACFIPAFLVWSCSRASLLLDKRAADARVRCLEADIRAADARLAACRAQVAEQVTALITNDQQFNMDHCRDILSLNSTNISMPTENPIIGNLTIGASLMR